MTGTEARSSAHAAINETATLPNRASPGLGSERQTPKNDQGRSTSDRQRVRPLAMAPLLTPDELSRYLGVPTGTLTNWRYQGRGPAFVRLGRHVRYRGRDIDEWVNGQLAGDRS